MKTITPIFFGFAKNGVLEFENLVEYQIWLEGINGEFELTINERKKQRTIDQNSWYWGVVLPVISESTGHTPEELHEVFKDMFLGKKTILWNGEEKKIQGSSASLFTQGFGEYIERIRAEVATMGITIPDPERVSI